MDFVTGTVLLTINFTGWCMKSKKPGGLHRVLQKVFRRGPTLPGACAPSTIGAGGLNGRVRDGNGCGPSAIPTGNQDARGKNIDARNMLFVEDAIFSLPLSSCFLFSEDCIAVQISDQVLDRLVPVR